jgi:hypothetical protein
VNGSDANRGSDGPHIGICSCATCLVDRGVDENTTVVFPASLMTTIAVAPIPVGTVNGASQSS